MSGEFAGRRVVVMGLGRFGGGIGVARWLASQGADVRISDRADRETLAESIAKLDGLGIDFRCGRHDPADLDGADLLVVSPAVDKRKSEFVAAARAADIPITSEMNLFFERCRGRIVGITGTTGKSTTCAMLEQVLRTAAERGELKDAGVHLGGNIGQSLLGELDNIGPRDLVVLELSSFQLEDLAALRRSPAAAVITNCTPRHLDRHGTFPEYLECKLNICRFQERGDFVVLGTDNPNLVAAVTDITDRTGARVILAGDATNLSLKIRGAHNLRNASVAACVGGLIGASHATAAAALADFGGLRHRLQHVRRIDEVDYFNDSKGTSVEAVVAALESFTEPVTLIAGGADRDESWAPVAEHLGRRVTHAVCMGENGPKLAKTLRGTVVKTLDQAVSEAHRLAKPGGVVLLSPGCPSYDQFVNYEARGDAFVRAVERL